MVVVWGVLAILVLSLWVLLAVAFGVGSVFRALLLIGALLVVWDKLHRHLSA